MRKILCGLLLSISLWGCSSQKTNQLPKQFQKLKNLTVYPANARPKESISFKKDAFYGSTKKVLIGSIGGVTVDDSSRVYIADIQKMTIDVFDSSGHYETHFGQKGRGPSEFEVISGPYINAKRLYVYDPVTLRISIFSLDSLKLLKTLNMNTTNLNKIKTLAKSHVHQLFPINDTKYLVSFSKPIPRPPYAPSKNIDTLSLHYYFINGKGEIISKQLFKIKNSPILTGYINGRVQAAGFSFFYKPLITVSHDGYIASAGSDNFLIKEYNNNGNYLHAIYYPYKKERMTREAALRLNSLRTRFENVPGATTIIKFHQAILKQNEIPNKWPALNKIKFDDHNQLWIATIVKNMKVYQWWVLTQNGKLIARFNWPRNKPIEVIKKGYIYTREKDTTTGFQKIVRYRIEMTPSKK